LLKDVFDYSLDEIAEMVGSTAGGVKAALNRSRSKLSGSRHPMTKPQVAQNDEATRLRDLYVERFNRKDWDGVRELITADARLVVADRFGGPVEGAPYFGRYDRLARPWRLAPGEVDGETVLLVLEPGANVWVPQAIVTLSISDGQIVGVVDYTHCPWVLSAATVVRADDDPVRTHIQNDSVSVLADDGRRGDNDRPLN
jgi:RNA polymerase sigma-70 factor (ECF subfamily)